MSSAVSSGAFASSTGLLSLHSSSGALSSLLSSSSSAGNATLTLEELLGYQPSEAAALIFCFLFVSSAAVLLVMSCRTRTWFVFIGVFTAVAEAGGFGLRFLTARSTDIPLGPYIGSTLLILVAPNGLAALNYSAMARMIRVFLAAEQSTTPLQGPVACRIPFFTDRNGDLLPTRVSRTFILSDILCIALQFAGAIMAGASDPQQVSTGHSLIIAGFSLQFIFFALYMTLVLRLYALHCSLKQQGAKLELADHSLYPTSRLDGAFVCIFATIALITARNAFRMTEAESGYVASHEVFTYLFDALLILMCFVIFSVFHFGFFLPRSAPVSRAAKALQAGAHDEV